MRSEREDSRLENIITLTLSFKKKNTKRENNRDVFQEYFVALHRTYTPLGRDRIFFFFLSRTAVNKRRRAIAAKVSVLLKKRLQPWQPRD